MTRRSLGTLGAALVGLSLAAVWEWGASVGRAGGIPFGVPPSAAGAVPAGDAIEAAAREIRAGRADEALRLIRHHAGGHPGWPPARVILARLHLAADQAAAGRRALEQAAAEAPDHPEVYLSMGALSLVDGRFSDARLNFETARTLAGSGRWAERQARAYRRGAAAGLAAVAEAREDWEAARQSLSAVLEIDPKDGRARQRLGRALFRLGKADEAFAALKQAVADAPDLEPAAVSMAWLYSQKEDVKKAEEWFRYACQVEPGTPRVHRAFASWLLEDGRAAEARTEADEAARLEPGSKEAQRLRALIAWHLGDAAEAQRVLEPLHREAPADLGVANLLALSLVEQDDPARRARGLQLAEVGARQSPRSAEALATLGWALYRSGRVDQAEPVLRQAVSGVRTTTDIAYFLARVLVDKGQADDARKLLKSATGLPGAFAHRKDAVVLLQTLSP